MNFSARISDIICCRRLQSCEFTGAKGPLACHPSAPVQSHPDLCQKLIDAGCPADWLNGKDHGPRVALVLAGLRRELDQKEAWVSRAGNGQVLWHVETVTVYLRAEVDGEERCMVERKQFDLCTGVQHRDIMRPLQKNLRAGETWREAVRRVLASDVGIHECTQDAHIQISEESHHLCEEELASSDFPELRTVRRAHEVDAYIRREAREAAAAAETPSEDERSDRLRRLGLPAGSDFVAQGTGDHGGDVLRVWCWTSRECELSRTLKAFESYLEGHGVDIPALRAGGVFGGRGTRELYAEANELQECLLEEAPGGVGLRRVVSLLVVKIIARVERRKRVLFSPQQVLADGRQRKVNRLLTVKLKRTEAENWGERLRQELSLQLGVEPAAQDECFTFDRSREECVEELRPSEGPPGLPTLTRTRYITMHVVDPEHPAVEPMGLPRGHDFIMQDRRPRTRGPGRLHVWTWILASDEEKEDEVFVDTAFGELSRTLHDAERLVTETRCHPQIDSLGLETPLSQTLEKIRRCIERFSDIDKTLSEVRVRGMMDEMGKFSADDKEDSQAGIVDFIAANFTRTPSLTVNNAAATGVDSRQTSSSGRPSRKRQSTVELETLITERFGDQKLAEVVQGVADWGFDLFALDREANSRVVEIYGEVVLVQHCQGALSCGTFTTRAFLKKVASLYQPNPYHNAIHAAQVCHSAVWLTRCIGLADEQSDIEHAAFMIAAMCHDVKHFGRNNAFCVNTEHALALKYNDSRVLENMHAATCIELLQSSGEASMLEALMKADRVSLRSQIIEYILATDMSEHFEIITKFRVKRDSPDFSMSSEPDRHFIARMCMKAGDIGHAALPWGLHEAWSVRVTQEFFLQGDEERSLGMTVSALCDRQSPGDIGKSQKGFLEFVCLPLFEELARFQASDAGDAGGDPEDSDDDKRTVKSQPTVVSRDGTTTSLSTCAGCFHNANVPVRRTCIAILKENAKHWVEDLEVSERVLVELRSTAPTEAVAAQEDAR